MGVKIPGKKCYIIFEWPLSCTVVPALGDPRREWPPAVYGHVITVPTHFNVKLPAIGGHLPNVDADSHLLVVRTCYNGQPKQMFSVSFNPKSLVGTLTSDRQFAKCRCCRLVTSSGDYKHYFILMPA